MKVPDYEIVKYDPSLLDGVLRLQRRLWGTDEECNRRYFEWKYKDNPYAAEPLIYVVLYRDEAVAMRGMYGVYWEIGAHGERVPGLCAGDTVVAPGHRGRGLFRFIMNEALADLRQKGYEYILNFGAGRTMRLLSLRSGWKRVAPYGKIGRFRAPWRHPSVTRLLKAPSIAPLLAGLGGTARAALSRLRSRPGGGQVEASPFRRFDRAIKNSGQPRSLHLSIAKEPRPEAMAALAAMGRKAGHIRHVCSPDYFAWRFRNPRSDYRFVYWGDAQLEGYLVLEAPSFGSSRTVSLVDWQWRNYEIANEMLRTAITSGRFHALKTWSISIDQKVRKILDRAGFRPMEAADTRSHPAAGPLIIRVTENQPAGAWDFSGVNALHAENWDFRMIWSDSH